MGVIGLWSLVDGVGHPINLETLHNKVLAIDLSIWINQSIKGFRDKEGRVLDNAHVLGLFHRVCKLLFYKIKPVFVFDGNCPQLKRRTVERRHEQRMKAIEKCRDGSIKILENYIASQLSTRVEGLRRNASLPSLKSSLLELPKNESMRMYEELVGLQSSQGIIDESDGSDNDYEPSIAHNYRDIQNLDSIDVNCDHFQSLPPEVRYEILMELKQKYKGWRSSQVMPKESNDFSNYQMEKLLKKRRLQHEIENTIKALNGHSSDEVIQGFNQNEFYLENETNAGRLMSDENTNFILMKKTQTKVSNNLVTNIDVNINEKDSQNHVNNNPIICENHSMSSSLKDSNEKSLVVNLETSDDEEVIQSFTPNISIVGTKNENKESFDSLIVEKRIEISDESDIEELIQPIDQNNCIENKIKNDLKESSNSLTIIKDMNTKVSNSETSDDDFEDVWPQSPDSMDDLISQIDSKELQNLISNKTTLKDVNSQESALNRFETFLESMEKSDDCLSTQNVESEKSLPNISAQETEPTSSQWNQFSRISRDELQTKREVNKQNRYANYTTDKMMADCQELLKLFGVPFIISPTEAEAQCAALEELGLTNGTITDDSDVLLFGAQTVYKNFFTSSKYVELFKSSDIESRFGLSRSALICIAMLCGSDYTDGVDGVGAVKATEILSEFAATGLQPLVNFKNWWLNKQNSKDKKPENNIRAQFMKLKLHEGFPNEMIFNAYMNPNVDTSKEEFSWGMPRLDELRRYAMDRFGWTHTKADQILLPVMKKVNEKQTQMTIDNYFKVKTQTKDTLMVSKRLNKAINKLRGVESEPHSSFGKTNSSRNLSQKVKNQRKRCLPKNNQNKGKSIKQQKAPNSKPQVVNLSESSDSD